MVSRVEERKNYQAYSAGGAKPQSGGGLGSLGDFCAIGLEARRFLEQPGAAWCDASAKPAPHSFASLQTVAAAPRPRPAGRARARR